MNTNERALAKAVHESIHFMSEGRTPQRDIRWMFVAIYLLCAAGLITAFAVGAVL